MSLMPYAIVFLVGVLVGAYAANLKFRTQVNAGFKKLAKQARKINVEKGLK
jgi:hypothetical protein